MGIYIISKINKIAHIEDHEIYRDDGTIVIPYNKRNIDSIGKKLHKMFKGLYYDIRVEIKWKVVQFYDKELNLLIKTIPLV